MWEWHCRCQLPNNSSRILGFIPTFVVGLHIQNAEERSLVSESNDGDSSPKSPSYMTEALLFLLSHPNSHLVYLFSPSPGCWFSLSHFISFPLHLYSSLIRLLPISALSGSSPHSVSQREHLKSQPSLFKDLLWLLVAYWSKSTF